MSPCATDHESIHSWDLFSIKSPKKNRRKKDKRNSFQTLFGASSVKSMKCHHEPHAGLDPSSCPEVTVMFTGSRAGSSGSRKLRDFFKVTVSKCERLEVAQKHPSRSLLFLQTVPSEDTTC